MRLRIILRAEENIEIPINYNHIIQKNIYELLEKDYAKFLHDKGYVYNNKSFKLFTYSKLVIENKIVDIKRKRITIKPGRVEMTTSSINERFIFDFIDGLIRKKGFHFREGILRLEHIYSHKSIKTSKLVALTISPVVVTRPHSQNNIQFYSPLDNQFIESIQNNLKDKYKAHYKKDYCGECSVKILDMNNVKKKIEKYKNWIYEAYMCGFVIEGDSEIIDVAYSCGIGSKNSQGFGSIERFKDLNNLNSYIKVI